MHIQNKMTLYSFLSIFVMLSCSDGQNLQPREQSSKLKNEDPKEKDNDDIITTGSDSKGIAVDDGKPPPYPDNFKASATENSLEISLTWEWIDSTRDMQTLKITRSEGKIAPYNCDDGETILETSDKELEEFLDTTEEAKTFSYRLCTFDPQGNQDDGNTTEEDITPLDDCGGELVGGHCWYSLTIGEKYKTLVCSELCQDHGGFNALATNQFAGSKGTDANCKEVLDALDVGSGDVSTSAFAFRSGCIASIPAGTRIRGTAPDKDTLDNPGASGTNFTRVCGCNK